MVAVQRFGQPVAACDTKFFVGGLQVVRNRTDGQPQAVGDGLAGQPGGGEIGDLVLTLRQPRVRRGVQQARCDHGDKARPVLRRPCRRCARIASAPLRLQLTGELGRAFCRGQVRPDIGEQCFRVGETRVVMCCRALGECHPCRHQRPVHLAGERGEPSRHLLVGSEACRFVQQLGLVGSGDEFGHGGVLIVDGERRPRRAEATFWPQEAMVWLEIGHRPRCGAGDARSPKCAAHTARPVKAMRSPVVNRARSATARASMNHRRASSIRPRNNATRPRARASQVCSCGIVCFTTMA